LTPTIFAGKTVHVKGVSNWSAPVRPRYLFRRKDSDNYYVRLQPPGQKVVERSLGTSDVKAAEIAAADIIKQHKQLMYVRRLARLPRVEPRWVPAYAPGMHDGFFATERDLRDPVTGAVIGPNGGPAEVLTPAPSDGVPSFEAYDAAKARPTPATKGSDDDLLETYLKHNGIDGLRERQARAIWHIFKTVVNKPLKQCTREDGRALVAHMEEQAGGEDEIKSATLRRRMVPLVATVNLAIDEGKLTFNPFSSVVPVRDDEDERDPFDDDDMALIRANLHKLDKNDQLLVRLVATTGLRRGEAFEIDREQTENGIRFVTIGTKTPQSLRRVPLPAELLPYLPDKISGQLISGRMDSAGKRLGKWMFEIAIPGIPDPDIINAAPGELDKAPMHSFRHRAAQRLRAAGVPEDVREAVGGWANGKKKKTSRKYGNKHGAGYPLSVLKEAIDKIGF
jgi:integrase